MKYRAIILVAFLLSSLFAYYKGVENTRHKNFDADKFAAEWGCQMGALHACKMATNENYEYECMEYMRAEYCPEASAAFERFLKQSSNGAE